MRFKLICPQYTETTFTLQCQVRYDAARYSSCRKIRRPALKRIYRLACILFVMSTAPLMAQAVVYDNFEGNKVVYYVERAGVLDTNAANPAVSDVNSSAKCALYVRNSSVKFDNIKMKLNANLADVTPYASHDGAAPRLRMKIYTAAPPGTLVEILLTSRRGNNDYPAGTHSQYQAYTTITNKWEQLEFKFSQVPEGSETASTQVDQVILLFNPNSNTSDTFYFDDITGPGLVSWPADKIATPPKNDKKPEASKKERPTKKISSK